MRTPRPKPLPLLHAALALVLLPAFFPGPGLSQELDLLPQEAVVTQHTATIQ